LFFKEEKLSAENPEKSKHLKVMNPLLLSKRFIYCIFIIAIIFEGVLAVILMMSSRT
jgi:hypothetical protein